MLSAELSQKLNDQIGLEFYSANLYLQMSSWCLAHGLEGCAGFMRGHSEEERGHMTRLFDYVNEAGGMAMLGTIDAPRAEYEDVGELFAYTYEHEQIITQKINELVSASFSAQDFSTFNFLQWYVAEQHEEENLFKTILDKVKLTGIEGRGLYHFDQEVAKMWAASQTAEPAV